MQNLITFKVLVLGSQGVGKSCLVMRYLKGEFEQNYNVTVGVEFASKMVLVEPDLRVRLQIWDTAGQEMFKSLVRSFYQGISAVFLVYAINKEASLRQLEGWAAEVRERSHPEIELFLIGAKADCEQEREVNVDMASVMLKRISGAMLVETSSKTGQNIQLLFQKAADYMYKKFTTNLVFRELVQPQKEDRSTQSPSKSKKASILLNKQSFHELTVNNKAKRRCCN